MTVDNEKHDGRVWLVKTLKEQYEMFIQSETIESFKLQHPRFVPPSQSFFWKNRCPCVSSPVMQSCVDIHSSAVIHYMRCLSKVIRNKKQIKK